MGGDAELRLSQGSHQNSITAGYVTKGLDVHNGSPTTKQKTNTLGLITCQYMNYGIRNSTYDMATEDAVQVEAPPPPAPSSGCTALGLCESVPSYNCSFNPFL